MKIVFKNNLSKKFLNELSTKLKVKYSTYNKDRACEAEFKKCEISPMAWDKAAALQDTRYRNLSLEQID